MGCIQGPRRLGAADRGSKSARWSARGRVQVGKFNAHPNALHAALAFACIQGTITSIRVINGYKLDY